MKWKQGKEGYNGKPFKVSSSCDILWSQESLLFTHTHTQTHINTTISRECVLVNTIFKMKNASIRFCTRNVHYLKGTHPFLLPLAVHSFLSLLCPSQLCSHHWFSSIFLSHPKSHHLELPWCQASHLELITEDWLHCKAGRKPSNPGALGLLSIRKWTRGAWESPWFFFLN